MSCLSTAIKVNCIGSCGVSNKINDTAWTVEEQYFNSTLSLADKGTVHKALVQICGSEKLSRNVSPTLQHPLDVKYLSQAALACAQRMGARIRDYKIFSRSCAGKDPEPPCKHCWHPLALVCLKQSSHRDCSLSQGSVDSPCSTSHVCLWWSQNTAQSWSPEASGLL